MQNMTTFNSPQLLKRYKDGSIRIVTYNEIKEGDSITFKNEKWTEETVVVSSIKDSRSSNGVFDGYKIPTSYHLQIK